MSEPCGAAGMVHGGALPWVHPARQPCDSVHILHGSKTMGDFDGSIGLLCWVHAGQCAACVVTTAPLGRTGTFWIASL
jgi:hypothetical protein